MSSTPNSEHSSFISHLIDLRNTMVHIVLAVGVVFVAMFPFAKDIYNLFAQPLVAQGQEMVIIGAVAPFLIPMKLTLLVAFLVVLPFVFYKLWRFVAPGLYQHEKRLIIPLLVSSVLLFYLGVMFVYFIMLPMIFTIIPQFAPDVATYSPDIAQYLDFAMMMFMAFGFGFEMPIATILVIATGIASRESLADKRPYVVVGAFVLGMLLTPPDVISQVMLAVPMWLLFELGLIMSTLFKKQIATSIAMREADKKAKAASEGDPLEAGFDATERGHHGDDVDEDFKDELNASNDFDEEADHASLAAWENQRYTYEDVDDVDYEEDFDADDLSDAEMEAEMDKIDAEFTALDEQKISSNDVEGRTESVTEADSKTEDSAVKNNKKNNKKDD